MGQHMKGNQRKATKMWEDTHEDDKKQDNTCLY